MEHKHPFFDWDAEDLYSQSFTFCENCTLSLDTFYLDDKDERRVNLVKYWLGRTCRNIQKYWPDNDTSKTELDHIFDCLKAEFKPYQPTTTFVTPLPPPTTPVTPQPSPTTSVTPLPPPTTPVMPQPSPTTYVTPQPSPTPSVMPQPPPTTYIGRG